MSYTRIICVSALLFVCVSAEADARAPAFNDYPVEEVSNKVVESVDLSSDPKAKRFKTQLTNAKGKRPNFAGHYVVVAWGCGSFCEVVAMIDASSGKVYFAPFVTELGQEYKVDSALFIDSPPDAVREMAGNNKGGGLFRSRYYVWDELGKEFRLVFESE